MGKIYKTNIYKYTPNSGIEKSGKIIVESGIFKAKEVVTNQAFRILPNKECVNEKLAASWLKKYKEYFFVIEDNMIIATPDEIKKYVYNFKVERCPFYNIIKIQEENKKELLKRRI